MKSKTIKVVGQLLLALVGLFITSGAILKLVSFPPLVEIYTKTGLLDHMQILAIFELVFLGLFIWKKTMRIGLLFLTGYFGGAMAVELSHGTIFVVPGFTLSIIWIVAYLRDAAFYQPPRNISAFLK